MSSYFPNDGHIVTQTYQKYENTEKVLTAKKYQHQEIKQ